MIVNVSELEFAALPPDVRKVSDLPGAHSFFLWAMPSGTTNSGAEPGKGSAELPEGRRPSAHQTAEPSRNC